MWPGLLALIADERVAFGFRSIWRGPPSSSRTTSSAAISEIVIGMSGSSMRSSSTFASLRPSLSG